MKGKTYENKNEYSLLCIRGASRSPALRFPRTRRRSARRRMAAIPEAIRRKGRTLCLVSPPVASIRRLVSFRSGATPPASFNTAIGAGTLLASTADENTATGAAALLSNTTGPANTANGAFALFSNTTGGFNTATGDSALLATRSARRTQPRESAR